MKKFIILCLIICSMLATNAQKKQNTYFLKSNNKEVSNIDSADFVRIIEEPDSGQTNYIIKEFYKDGMQKLIGKASSFEPKIVYEGALVTYHGNGKRGSTVNYEKNALTGMAYFFFENGKLNKQLEYLNRDLAGRQPAVKSVAPEFKLIYQADSLGKVYVKDGIGHLIEKTKFDKDTLIEEGDYKDGFKEGIWKGKYFSGKSSYVETYAEGKFVSGVNTVGDQIIEYTILEQIPTFKGGINKFYQYLGRTIKYPKEAYTNGITGIVTVNFNVENDGRIVDAKVDKPVFPSMDEEAIRVIMASPKWIPGMQRGVPVRVAYNIPISFALPQ